ncbi:acyltransferase, partial [Bacteroides sp. OttesenSCG-928-D19]|nr:acyltransferase [Bacteroides sp. OttesenSCG-928-D19]
MLRNYSIDVLRFLAAILVVFLHTPIYWGREFILPITRCAVPLFFIISGYYLFNKDVKILSSRLRKSISKTFFILCYSSLVYAAFSLLRMIFTNYDLVLDTQSLVNFLLFNVNPFGFHLWYLQAFIYALIIILFFCKLNILRCIFLCIPLLLSVDLIFGKYSLLFLGREFPYIYLRNFLFVGLPYVSLGLLIKKYEKKILKVFSVWIGLVIVGALISVSEYCLLDFFSLNATRDHYVGSTILSISLFLAFLNYKKTEPTVCSQLGKRLSLDIY